MTIAKKEQAQRWQWRFVHKILPSRPESSRYPV
jgi:hypothetical protein